MGTDLSAHLTIKTGPSNTWRYVIGQVTRSFVLFGAKNFRGVFDEGFGPIERVSVVHPTKYYKTVCPYLSVLSFALCPSLRSPLSYFYVP